MLVRISPSAVPHFKALRTYPISTYVLSSTMTIRIFFTSLLFLDDFSTFELSVLATSASTVEFKLLSSFPAFSYDTLLLIKSLLIESCAFSLSLLFPQAVNTVITTTNDKIVRQIFLIPSIVFLLVLMVCFDYYNS